ncbi:potassium transporter Kup [Rhodanobacter glycinis]|uniref:Probable potassium transport system protein Kup n=1 Tax=Rhodanobacter glycinis TaxID=582702 RepID=A0A1I4BDA7_9GAMM|nr:potassium transporter Kup [Rhodanobacter glycinis]SFK66792.1 KUP system potassium uptake protein [Rhodanobacter glycinis]
MSEQAKTDQPAQAASDGDVLHGSKKALILGAVGVVFGDIGTSPLYTMHETFLPEHGLHPYPSTVLGILSLVTWSLIMVVAVKYVSLVMRADNKGEGGIMALMALAQRASGSSVHMRRLVVLMAVLGAALFIGDGVITPSISVLSAVEGVKVAAPQMEHLVVPVTVAVLLGLFWLQRHGTAKVGALFGPVMVLWFLSLGAIGVWNIFQAPGVLRALNPWYAVEFFMTHGRTSILALGSVVLCVTGAEALYTDMGHFGRFPIRAAWFGFVMPALLLNYYGQGGLLLAHPEAIANPFYHAVPGWALYPMIALATLATVIASQAVISGAFTVTRQAIQLGFVPRMQVVHTSREAIGQIFLPWVNRSLMITVILTVIFFGSSNALAGAYGIAVTGTMAIDTTLTMIVARRMWHWNRAVVILTAIVLLTIDLSYFGANTLKIPDGGWFPLVLGVAMFVMMTTWRRGRELVVREIKQGGLALAPFIENISEHPPLRVPGTAVFLTANQEAVPHALLHNLKHNKVLHERNVLLTVEVLETPVADSEERIKIEDLGGEFYGLELRFGFAEDPNVPLALSQCARGGLPFDMMDTTFFLSRENIVADARRPGMALWRDKLFAFLSRNALPATAFFQIPGNRLIELGAQVEI